MIVMLTAVLAFVDNETFSFFTDWKVTPNLTQDEVKLLLVKELRTESRSYFAF